MGRRAVTELAAGLDPAALPRPRSSIFRRSTAARSRPSCTRRRSRRATARPALFFVHGGPESQTRAVFNPVIQYFAHRGFTVIAPNVRGSSGYGREYLKLDDVERRMDAVRDLAAAPSGRRRPGSPTRGGSP